MLAHILALFLLIPLCQAFASIAQARTERRAQLVEQLNQQFKCKIMMFNRAEQATYAREISIPECKPSDGRNFIKAGELLKQLADISTPVDAQVLREQSRSFVELGNEVVKLEEIRNKILSSGIVQVRDGRLAVDFIGHPFQKAELNSTRWLEAYVTAVRRMTRNLNLTPDHPVDGCMAPVCDRAMFRLAEAVTARPALDPIYLAEQRLIVPPHPYAFSYFSQRYMGDGEVRRSLGLNENQRWLWNVDNYSSHLTKTGELIFPDLFYPESSVTMSIANYSGRNEFPFVVPMFMLFQEAGDILSVIREMKGNSVATRIRDIRFEQASEGGPLLRLGKIPGGEYILHVHILGSPGDLSVSAQRENLHRQLPGFLQTAVQLAQQQ